MDGLLRCSALSFLPEEREPLTLLVVNMGSSKEGEGRASVRGQQQLGETSFSEQRRVNREQLQTRSLYLRQSAAHLL